MPITSSAKKALRNSAKKRVFNLKRKKEMNDILKKFRKLTFDKKIEEAKSLVPQVYKAIDKAAKNGIIKSNTASRKKSRLVRLLKNIS